MQDRAIIEIGRLRLEELKKANKQPYQFFIQNMFPKKADYDMVSMVFDIDKDFQCAFREADMDKVSEKNYESFAYRKGSARGGDITFTTKFGDINKKFKVLLNNQLKSLVERLTKSVHTKEFKIFRALYHFLLDEKNADEVKAALTKIHAGLPKKQQQASGLSLVLWVDGSEHHLSDFKIIQEILYENGTQEKSKKYDVTSEGANELCAGCLQQKPVLHGFGSPYKYATVDKPGMVAGFFKQKDNWKNYPICTQCSMEFELGRSYIAQHLSKSFYGKFYYAIPKTILNKDPAKLKKAINKLKTLYGKITAEGKQHQIREEMIWEMVAKEDDYFNLNLVFYEENATTKAIKIKLMLEEVIPSQFRKLFVDAPRQVNPNPLYKDALTIKKKKQHLFFTFGLLKTFFDNDFYGLIQKVFRQQPIAEETLYARFMQVIRTNYNKSQTSDGFVENPRTTVLKAHLALCYLQEIEVIKSPKNVQQMNTDTPNQAQADTNNEKENKTGFDPQRIEQFIHDNAGFLSDDAKTGVFLLGTLVKHVLDVQYNELNGNMPFEKKLKGYQLSPAHLQNIYTEAIAKSRQYKKEPVILTHLIAQYFVKNVQKVQKMSNNEASFYLVAGMQFNKELKYPKTESKK